MRRDSSTPTHRLERWGDRDRKDSKCSQWHRDPRVFYEPNGPGKYRLSFFTASGKTGFTNCDQLHDEDDQLVPQRIAWPPRSPNRRSTGTRSVGDLQVNLTGQRHEPGRTRSRCGVPRVAVANDAQATATARRHASPRLRRRAHAADSAVAPDFAAGFRRRGSGPRVVSAFKQCVSAEDYHNDVRRSRSPPGADAQMPDEMAHRRRPGPDCIYQS